MLITLRGISNLANIVREINFIHDRDVVKVLALGLYLEMFGRLYGVPNVIDIDYSNWGIPFSIYFSQE